MVKIPGRLCCRYDDVYKTNVQYFSYELLVLPSQALKCTKPFHLLDKFFLLLSHLILEQSA